MDIFDLQAKISLDIQEYIDGLDGAEKKTSSFGSKLKTRLATAAKVGAATIGAATTAIAAFGGTSIKTGMDFDASMSQVAATMGTTVDNIQKLRDFAQEMGRTTAFSASQAADALNYMALAGYSAEESMQALPNVLNLAAAGGIELAAASDMVTDAQSALGLSFKESAELVDKMAKASSKSNTSVAQLGDAILTVGGTAQTLAGGTTELTQVLGLLADNGIKGAEGGTALRNVILSLSAPTDAAREKMQDLGLKIFDAEGNMRPMVDIFGELNGALSTMTQGERTQVLSDLFNKVDLKSVNALLQTNVDRWDELASEIDNAHGAAEAMAETQLDNLAGDITLFKSALEGAQIVVSDQLTPSIREFVQFGSEGVSRLTEAFSEGGLSGAMDELGVILSEGIIKITDKMPTLVDAGTKLVMSLVEGTLSNLPKLVKPAIEIVKTLAKNISKNIKPLLQAFVGAITDIAKELTNPITLSDLIDAALDMILALADGLIEAVPQLIKAIPQIIKNLVNGLAKNAGKIASAGVELFKGLITGLTQANGEILKAIPGLIASIAKGLIQGTSQIIKGTFNALFGIEDGAAQAAERIREHVEALESYRRSISELTPTIGDFNKVLSDSGKTIPQIDEEIADTEEKITAIISRALSENRELRAGEIEAIKKYNEEIRALEEERLSIYYDTQIGTLKKIQLESGQITADIAEQYKVDAQAARDAAIETTEQFYTDQLARIENGNKAGQYANETAYQAALDAAKQSRDERIAVTEEMYANSLSIINESSDKWVQTDAEKWAKLSDQMAQFSVNSDSWFSNFINSANDWVGNYDGAKTRYLEMLDEMDFGNTNAFLNMQAQVKASGKEIPSESKKMVNNILKSFEDLPEGLDDAGKDALLGLISGMEDYIPGLNNASSMSANEIVKTLRKELGIHSPSTVLKDVGENAGIGLINGLQAKKNDISALMQSIAKSIMEATKKLPNEMYSVGVNIANGIWSGISARRGALMANVRGMMDDIVKAVKDKMDIHSPSRVMARIGEQMAQGIDVGWQNAFGDVRGDISESLRFDAPTNNTDGRGDSGTLTVIVGLLQSILDNMGYDVVLDSGALIGAVDRGLGTASLWKARGN